MDSNFNTNPLLNYSQLKGIENDFEYLLFRKILDMRLIGLSDVSIYEALEGYELADIRKHCTEVDSWLGSGFTLASDHFSKKEIEKLLTVKQFDYLIAQRIKLLASSGDGNLKNRILNSLKEDISKRAEVLGVLGQNNKGQSEEMSLENLPDIEFPEELLKRTVEAMKRDKEAKAEGSNG